MHREDQMAVHTCTYCGGTKFYEGPGGGMSVNVLCANEECRHWFNATPFGFEDLKRVEPNDAEKEAARAAANNDVAKLRQATYLEGAEAYRAGRTAFSCVSATKNNPIGFYNAAGDDIVRLAGWLDASQGRDRDIIVVG
jgi:hypothetical protein